MGQRGILRLIAEHTCRLTATMLTNIKDPEWFLQNVQEMWCTYTNALKTSKTPYERQRRAQNFKSFLRDSERIASIGNK
jgi:hypothetical protein